MRGLVLLCALAACGNDAGLLLDIHPGDANVVRVEVLLPGEQHGQYMGVPTGLPATQGKKVAGPVYAVIDTTGGTIDSNGALRVLLTPGSITEVPALLVLGYDAHDTPLRFAVVTNPSGAIALPHTTSSHLLVDLDPITAVPITSALTSMAAPRLVRWDGTSYDSANAKCFGVLYESSNGHAGIFFGPDGDLDCDHAQPECDDTWFMRVRGAGSCATANDPTTGTACRIGTTAGCIDGMPNATACTPQEQPAICVPAPVCAQCRDLDPSCVAQQLAANPTTHIDCTIFVQTQMDTTACSGQTFPLMLQGMFGPNFSCTGTGNGFIDPMMPAGMLVDGLPLDAVPNGKLAFSCDPNGTDLNFAVVAAASTTVDPHLPPTHGALTFTVSSPTSGPRRLVIPINVQYRDVSGQVCPPSPTYCAVVPDTHNGTTSDDPIWQCAGG